MTDDTKYVKDLVREGEHQQQDFKFEISNAKKIAKTLVAFANTDGGRLLIGVKDNGRISGIRSDEEFYMIDAAATMYCKPEIPIKSYQRIVEGKNVLEILIQASEEKPHYAMDEEKKWRAYHRVHDNNFLVDYILLQVWKREKREAGTFIKYSLKEKMILEILKDEGIASFSFIKKELRIKKRELQNQLVNLISLKAISMRFEEDLALFELME